MSGYDIFAWIVLIILLVVFIGVFCLIGALPGHIARSRRHPWAAGNPRRQMEIPRSAGGELNGRAGPGDRDDLRCSFAYAERSEIHWII
jgi:hypothetical protein